MNTVFSRPFRMIVVGAVGISLLVYAVIFRATFHPKAPEKKPEINWWLTFESTSAPAKEQRKFILADIYTDWCHYCAQLDRDVFSKPEVISYLNENFICVKVNANDPGEGSTVANALNVHAYPCALVFSPDGVLVGQVRGYMDSQTYLNTLKGIVAQAEKDNLGTGKSAANKNGAEVDASQTAQTAGQQVSSTRSGSEKAPAASGWAAKDPSAFVPSSQVAPNPNWGDESDPWAAAPESPPKASASPTAAASPSAVPKAANQAR